MCAPLRNFLSRGEYIYFTAGVNPDFIGISEGQGTYRSPHRRPQRRKSASGHYRMAGYCLAQAFGNTMECGWEAMPAMAHNGHNRGAAPQEVNPGHIVSVKDFSPETLRNVVAHLKASTSFEHLVYREAELDAIWTITGFFLANEPTSRLHEAVKALHAGAHRAHDLVAERQPGAAATVLEDFL